MIGYIWSSCVNAGSEFGARFRIVGEKASIAGDAEHPNQLQYEVQGSMQGAMQRGAGYLYTEARADERIGGEHQRSSLRHGAASRRSLLVPSTRTKRANRLTSGIPTYMRAPRA